MNVVLEKSLGKFYFSNHNNRPPTFLQIVGWTKGACDPNKKRVHVYVRKVPLQVVNGLNIGEWSFDKNIIREYSDEIVQPVHKNVNGLVDFNAIISPLGDFIRFEKMTIPLRDVPSLKPSS